MNASESVASLSGVSLSRTEHRAEVLAFAEQIGGRDAGPVCVVGGGTQWEVGGLPAPGTRNVSAPAGIVSIEPAELIARCGAGTTWGEFDDALASVGMMSPIDAVDRRATVGGSFAVGHSGVRRLRYGHIRDLLLEARYVDADGKVIKSGAPVVKNVTGYDLCRLLVGSLGTLGCLAEVVVRCRPRPAVSLWLTRVGVDPFGLRQSLVSPGAILWDGARTTVLLEGSNTEVRVAREALGSGWTECSAPDLAALPVRRSLRPSELRDVPRRANGVQWLAEVGVGTVRLANDPGLSADPVLTERVRELNESVRRAFDPAGRLNPGRKP